MCFFSQNSVKKKENLKSTKNRTKTQAPQGFPAHFASFVTFPKNPIPESIVGVRFIEPDKWVRFVKSVTRKRLSFRAKRGIPKLLAKGIPRCARNDRLRIKKNAKNEAEIQAPKGFPAHFASFVTFPANPLPASVLALFLEKWVRFVKSQKLGSFGKIPKWVRFVKTEKLRKSGSFGKIIVGVPLVGAQIEKNAKNQAKTQALQGFPAQFASFVTFPENPLPDSVSTLFKKSLFGTVNFFFSGRMQISNVSLETSIPTKQGFTSAVFMGYFPIINYTNQRFSFQILTCRFRLI